jgi:hypothetical protein
MLSRLKPNYRLKPSKTEAKWDVVLNGKTILDNIYVDGITGGAINPFEGEPGPLMLQGDHGKVRFRNIVLTPAS